MVANQNGNTMKVISIKGTPYIEVNERIKFFRANYENWSIETELLTLENGFCVIKATVKDENGIIKSTGHAYEKEDSSFINKTSYIENCETSAVGRALGILGIGIDKAVASYEEVENAKLNQQREQAKAVYTCSECGEKITESVHKFSTGAYGKDLCFNCQNKLKKKN